MGDRRELLIRCTGLLCGAAWLAAGLALAAHPAQAASAPLEWRVVTLPPPVTGASSFAEPGIAIRSDGTAVANAATANSGAPPTLWISRDSGSSWAPGQDFDTTGASTGDADAALGADGTLYALDLGFNPSPPGQPTNPTVFVFRSYDGSSWTGPASFPPPHGDDQPDRPWLVVDPQNAANVDVAHSEGGGNIVFWRSQDRGATFSGPILVSGGANTQAALALSSRPLFDPTDDQRLFMLFETVSAAGLESTLSATPPVYEFPMTQLWLAVSNDAGLTWTDSLILDTATLASSPLQNGTLGHLLVASAVDAHGDLYAAFALRPSGGTTTGVYVMHSTDQGASWSAPTEVATPTLSNVMPALAVAPTGALYLSWYGSADADYRDSQAAWTEMFAESDDALAAQPVFTVSQIGAMSVHTGGIDAAGNVGANLGANWGLKDFQSIAVDGCGLPHPVWAADAGTPETETAVPIAPCAVPQPGVPDAPDAALLALGALPGWLLVRRANPSRR